MKTLGLVLLQLKEGVEAGERLLSGKDYGIAGGVIAILFTVVIVLYRKSEERVKKVTDSAEARLVAAEAKIEQQEERHRKERKEANDATMVAISNLFNEVRADAKETKAELKGVIEKNTSGFFEMSSSIKDLQRMDRNK